MIWRGLATIKERATDERASVSGGLLGYSRVVVKKKKKEKKIGESKMDVRVFWVGYSVGC